MEVGTPPSYKEKKIKDGTKVQKKTKSKVILSVLSILGKQVRAHALTVDPSGKIACVLLWEHPRWLGVYLLLAHGTGRQSHHKVVSRSTQDQIMAFQMALCSTPPS